MLQVKHKMKTDKKILTFIRGGRQKSHKQKSLISDKLEINCKVYH